MNEREFAELAAGAAVHALSAEDEQRYLRALAENPQWQAIADDDADVAALLAAGAPAAAPPASIRTALLDEITRTPQTTTAPEQSGGETRSGGAPRPHRMRMLFALAACLVVLGGLGFGAVAMSGILSPPASVVALQQIESAADAQQASVDLESGGTATAHWSPSLGSVVLVTDGVAEPDPGKTYELWFVRGETPIPAGVFSVDAGAATTQLDGQMQTGDVIAVTVEQDGGSPTGLPTTTPVIVIPTA